MTDTKNGFNCGLCGQWVPYGAGHNCYSGNPEAQAPDNGAPSYVQDIAVLIERLEQVERRVEALEKRPPSQGAQNRWGLYQGPHVCTTGISWPPAL